MTVGDCSTATKTCSQCGQEKSISEFYKGNGSCKKCFNARYKSKYIKKTKTKKNCVRCGNEFLPTIGHQRYCLEGCQKSSVREFNTALSKEEGLKKVCFTCGIEKQISEYNSCYTAKYGVENQCKDCVKKERRKKTYGDEQTAKCEYCGTDFLKRSAKKYCSNKCRDLAKTVRNGGVPQPNRKPQRNMPVIDGKKQCTICGEIHFLTEFFYDKKGNRYFTYCNHCRRLKMRLVRGISKKKRKDTIAWTLRNGLKNNPDSHKSLMNVGYSIAELRNHIERQFTKGMSWERFNAGEIHIDHILPQASFDLSDPEEWKSCWALSNLRPLWKKDNCDKRAKITHLL